MEKYWCAILRGISPGIPTYTPDNEVSWDRIILKCKVMVDYMKMGRVEEKLKEELKRLQNIFNAGHSLSVKHLPNKIRYNQSGKPLSGECQGSIILIYESEEEASIRVLYHEYIEAMFIVPLVKNYYEVLHNQQKMLAYKDKMLAEKDEVIHRLLMQSKEEIVEALSNPIRKLASERTSSE